MSYVIAFVLMYLHVPAPAFVFHNIVSQCAEQLNEEDGNENKLSSDESLRVV
jgi:hypothetical protein